MVAPPVAKVTPLCFHVIGVGVGLPRKVHSSTNVSVSLTCVLSGMIVVKTGLTKNTCNQRIKMYFQKAVKIKVSK